MDTNTIREAILSRPFKPFSLRMNDGREFFIPHPEFLAVSKRAVMLYDQKTDAGIYLKPVWIASMRIEETPELNR